MPPSESPLLSERRRRGANLVRRSPPAVLFRVPAPGAHSVEVCFCEPGGPERSALLAPEGDGLFAATLEGLGPGVRYRFRLDGGPALPDPWSRHQPEDVHGPSEVVDPLAFPWSDHGFHRPRPEELCIYELHVGAFSPEGTFAGAARRLGHVRALGFTAIELMPVGDFPGGRNWGYDGAYLFAPEAGHGGPEGLRALVDSAHRLDLAVILDVVYNHLGPDGNHLGAYLPQLYSERRRTPWGAALNFDGPGCRWVRELVLHSALAWLDEFHLDGLRLDATHAIHDGSDEHIVRALCAAVGAAHPGGERPYVLLEDHRNLAAVALPQEAGGWGADGLWSYDFHASLQVALAAERGGIYRDFDGRAEELARILSAGWAYAGQPSVHLGRPRGSEPSALGLAQVVISFQNHDQVGNRPGGERLAGLVEPAAYRLALALLLLAPQTPLLFMGDEWGARTPFQYFIDHRPELARAIAAGRRRELRAPAASGPEPPGCDDPRAFLRSRLDWLEPEAPSGRELLLLVRELLSLRRREPALRDRRRASLEARAEGGELLLVRRGVGSDRELLLVANLGPRPREVAELPGRAGRTATLLLDTGERRFGGSGARVAGEAVRSPLALPGRGLCLVGYFLEERTSS